MEAGGLEDQLLLGSRDETTAWPAAADGLSGPTRCSPCALPRDPLELCRTCTLQLVGFLCCCFCMKTAGMELQGKSLGKKSIERQKQEWGLETEDGERENARCQSPWRLLSILAIDRKQCELEELHTALHLLFYCCYCCFWCITCSLGTATCIQSLSHMHPHTALK